MPLVALLVLTVLLVTALVWIAGLLWMVAVPVIIGGACLLGAAAWCVWWCFDPKGAGDALREAERAQARRRAEYRPPKPRRRR